MYYRERWLVHRCRAHALGGVSKVNMDLFYTEGMLPALMEYAAIKKLWCKVTYPLQEVHMLDLLA